MAVRYAIWQDFATKTFEVVMYDHTGATVIEFGIKTKERAEKRRIVWQNREAKAVARASAGK